MDFQQKLISLKEQIEGKMPRGYLDIMHNATNSLIASGIQEKVLKAGSKAPTFKLKNQKEEEISSELLLANGALVITFYRGIWCPYCNADLANLNQYKEEINQLGASLVAISPELPAYLSKTVRNQKLDFDLLHDNRNQLAEQFGLKFNLPDDLKGLYRDAFKIDLETHQGNEEWALPMPARFVIAKDGSIRYSESHPDYRNRPNPEEFIEVLRNL